MLKLVTMAAFSPKSTPPYNVRSISFPARSHPSVAKLEEELNKVRSLQQAPISSTTQSIRARLSSLGELYRCIEDLLILPMTQRALSEHQDGKLVNDMLDDLMRYLDVCGKTRDAIVSMKESVRELQSVLRRCKAASAEISIETDISAYICSRKKLKKDAAKSLTALKQTDNTFGESPILLNATDDHPLCAVVRVLREASLITTSIFSSLLMFLSVPRLKPKPSKWSLVSKLVHKGMVSCEAGGQQENMNELESVDLAITNLLVPNSGKESEAQKLHIQSAQKSLEILDTSIGEIEDELECLFRHLIHARVSLLNILSH